MLITCPECGTDVSDKAENCPKCGYPIASGAKGKSKFKEEFHRRAAEAQRTQSAMAIAGRAFFWRSWILAAAVFFLGMPIVVEVVVRARGPEVSGGELGFLIGWFVVALMVRHIYLVIKARAYERLPMDQFKKIWLEFGGFTEAEQAEPAPRK